jgi:biotin-(acetyl-CoA carboxylase) ligase
VKVTHSGDQQSIHGLAEGSDEWGRLLVRDEAGVLHTIAAGDVTLR